MSANWSSSENIFSLGVLPPETHTGHFSSIKGKPQRDSPSEYYYQLIWIAYIPPSEIDLTMGATDKIPPTARHKLLPICSQRSGPV